MLYPYAEFPHHLIITYSDIKTQNNQEMLIVNFEQPADFGFKEARFELPSERLISNEDFSQDEIKNNKRILRNNKDLIWDMARNKENDFS